MITFLNPYIEPKQSHSVSMRLYDIDWINDDYSRFSKFCGDVGFSDLGVNIEGSRGRLG